jgi:hypothetical protein
MQLWVVNDFQGVIVTQIEDRPAQRILYTLFLAGDNMSEWIDGWCEIQDEYARHNGCAAVEFNGRKGWNKIGESKPEWKAIRTVFRRELNQWAVAAVVIPPQRTNLGADKNRTCKI